MISILAPERERRAASASSSSPSLSLLDALRNALVLALAQTAAAPLERIKLVMQCEYALQRGNVIRGVPFQRAVPTATRLLTVEGLASLWRGNAANVARALPAAAVVYARVGQWQPFRFHRLRDGLMLWFLGSWSGAVASSALFLTLVYPLEFCRTALAADVMTAPNHRYLRVGVRTFPAAGASAYRACVRQAVTRGPPGGWGLYSGFGSAVLALAVFRAVHILGTDASSNYKQQQQQDYSVSATTAAADVGDSVVTSSSLRRPSSLVRDLGRAWAVCTAAGFAAYPLDTISRWCIVEMALSKPRASQQQQQQLHHGAAAVLRPRPSEIAKQAYRIGGLRIFMGGAMVNVLRNAVVTAGLYTAVSNGAVVTSLQ